MRLRRTLSENKMHVEAKYDDAWIPLADLGDLSSLADKYKANRDFSSSILTVLELGSEGWNDLQQELSNTASRSAGAYQNKESQILLPFKPKSFRDFMLFEDHIINSTRGYVKRFMPSTYRISSLIESITRKPLRKFHPHSLWYKQPIYYFGNHLNFVTDHDSICWPNYTDALDYELELGAILTRPIHNASTDEARDAIGGFVVLNDVSARDVQKDEMESGFGPQRAKHFINSMSAEVVTADEGSPALTALHGNVCINGSKVADCNGPKMQFSLPEAIAFVSQGEQLHSGELFGSGTIPGGSGLENGRWINPGDTLTLSIDGIGSLTNKIESDHTVSCQ